MPPTVPEVDQLNCHSNARGLRLWRLGSHSFTHGSQFLLFASTFPKLTEFWIQMPHDNSPKTADITVEVALTHDVEIIEMQNMGAQGKENSMTWAVSAPRSDETKAQGEWYDGFRRADRRKMKRQWDQGYRPEQKPTIPGDRHYDIRAANAMTATSALARELKGRHLQMIAFGGTIGKTPFPARERLVALK